MHHSTFLLFLLVVSSSCLFQSQSQSSQPQSQFQHQSQYHSYPNLIKRQSPTVGPNSTASSATNVSNSEADLFRNSLASGGGNFEHSRHELFSVVTEVNPTHLGISLIPAFIVIFGLFSAFVKEKLYAGEGIVAVVIGIILGPQVSGVFDPRSWGGGQHFDELTLELTRIVIALSVFAVGVELPKAYVLRHWRSLLLLLGPLMLIGWMVSGLLIYLLIPALNFLESLVVAAAVTPTDPILAASVVGKGKFAQKHVPAHLRHLLQAESGCNDGAAFPFLYLAMFLALRGDFPVKKVIGDWILLVLLYQIILGVVIGAVIGILARKTLKFCKRRSYIDRESMVAMYVALALLTTGVTTLAGSDDLLAAFACGTAFAWDDWFTESIEASNFSGIIDLLINCATFIYVGATIPFGAWNDATLTLVPWRLVLLAILVMLLRRLPAMLLLQALIPDLKTNREAVFCGHFGPIGVGAIFISTLATIKLPTPHVPPQNSLDTLALTVQPLVYLFVLFSVLVHGLSIPFFTLGRNVHSRVHSMTRTWTAQNNEPSWLNRVKRLDRTTLDGDIIEDRPASGVVSRADPAADIDLEKQANHNLPTINPDHLPNILPPQADDQGEATLNNGPGPPFAARPTIQRSWTAALGHGFRFPNLPPARTSSLFGRLRRTEEAEQARKEEKMKRDEWCRKERIDVTKKGEERVYRSGRHIIIERGDGDEVEVRDADPTRAAVERAKEDPKLGLVYVSASRLKTELQGLEHEKLSAASRRLEAIKRVVNRLHRRHEGESQSESKALPGPGQGPRSPRARSSLGGAAEDPARGPSPVSAHSGLGRSLENSQMWIEGSKIVVESNDGEDVHVYPNLPESSRPGLGKRSSSNSPEIQELSDDCDLIEVNRAPELESSNMPELARLSIQRSAEARFSDESKNPGPSYSDQIQMEPAGTDEDEWEEEEEEEEDPTTSRGRSHAHRHRASGARPRSTRHISSRRANKPFYNLGAELGCLDEVGPDMRRRHHLSPPATAKETDSRSSSPSRSIRFADAARPNRGKKPKKSRLELLKISKSSPPPSES